MRSAAAWVRSQPAMRQPLVSSWPWGKVPARVGKRSQAWPLGWSLVGFQAWASQQVAVRIWELGPGVPKACSMAVRPWSVEGVRQPLLVGSGWVQPLPAPVNGAGVARSSIDTGPAGALYVAISWWTRSR